MTRAAWSMSVPLAHARAAAMLRTTAGVHALLLNDSLWLCGDAWSEPLDNLLRQIPGQRFTRTIDDLLIPAGAHLPTAHLPEGPWKPLAELLPLHAPSGTLPARLPPRAAITLRPDPAEAPPNVLLTTPAQWQAWADTAPDLRLRPLRFALSSDAVLIHGSPLPALPGERFVERAGIAVPCGLALAPALPPETIAQTLGLAPGHLALIARDATVETLPAEVFVAATRSAVRASFAQGAA